MSVKVSIVLFLYLLGNFVVGGLVSQSSVIWQLLVYSAVVQNSSVAGKEIKLCLCVCDPQCYTCVHFPTLISTFVFVSFCEKRRAVIGPYIFKKDNSCLRLHLLLTKNLASCFLSCDDVFFKSLLLART